MAGMYHGDDSFPGEWLDVPARRKDIEALARRFLEEVTDPSVDGPPGPRIHHLNHCAVLTAVIE